MWTEMKSTPYTLRQKNKKSDYESRRAPLVVSFTVSKKTSKFLFLLVFQWMSLTTCVSLPHKYMYNVLCEVMIYIQYDKL